MIKVICNIIMAITLFLSGCSSSRDPVTYSTERIGELLVNYASSIEGVGSWDLIPDSDVGLYQAMLSGTYILDHERVMVFGWDDRYGFVYIHDGIGGKMVVDKNSDFFTVTCIGRDLAIGTDDDIVFSYRKGEYAEQGGSSEPLTRPAGL
jgi:hypothetical protein